MTKEKYDYLVTLQNKLVSYVNKDIFFKAVRDEGYWIMIFDDGATSILHPDYAHCEIGHKYATRYQDVVSVVEIDLGEKIMWVEKC